MDQLEAWAIRGRVATAISNVRESIARLARDGQELVDAMAEAEQFGVYDDSLAAAGAQATKGFAG